ncbi:MAG: cell division protein DedD [Aeromonas sp.]
MTSKLQNRLVGSVILVALIVIFLPDILDGNKQSSKEDEFTNIPLRPELEPAKPVLQVSAAGSTLPAEHQASQQQANQQQSATADQWKVEAVDKTNAVNGADQGKTEPSAEPEVVVKKPVEQHKPQVVVKKPVEQPKPKPKPKPEPKPEPKPKPKPKPEPKPEPKPKPAVVRAKPAEITSLDDLIESKMAKPAKPAASGSWVLQVGAYKNADSVNSLVSKLQAAGYPARSSPRTPVQGKINRVFIGPDVSKAKLQAMQSKLAQLTGSSGSVMAYHP